MLRGLVLESLHLAGRKDIFGVTRVAVKVGAVPGTGLLPDVVLIDTRPVGSSLRVGNVVLAAETWPSSDNFRSSQEAKIAAWEAVGVQYFWALNQSVAGDISVTSHRLVDGHYVEELTALPGETVTVTAAPEPVTFDPAVLSP